MKAGKKSDYSFIFYTHNLKDEKPCQVYNAEATCRLKIVTECSIKVWVYVWSDTTGRHTETD